MFFLRYEGIFHPCFSNYVYMVCDSDGASVEKEKGEAGAVSEILVHTTHRPIARTEMQWIPQSPESRD